MIETWKSFLNTITLERVDKESLVKLVQKHLTFIDDLHFSASNEHNQFKLISACDLSAIEVGLEDINSSPLLHKFTSSLRTFPLIKRGEFRTDKEAYFDFYKNRVGQIINSISTRPDISAVKCLLGEQHLTPGIGIPFSKNYLEVPRILVYQDGGAFQQKILDKEDGIYKLLGKEIYLEYKNLSLYLIKGKLT